MTEFRKLFRSEFPIWLLSTTLPASNISCVVFDLCRRSSETSEQLVVWLLNSSSPHCLKEAGKNVISWNNKRLNIVTKKKKRHRRMWLWQPAYVWPELSTAPKCTLILLFSPSHHIMILWFFGVFSLSLSLFLGLSTSCFCFFSASSNSCQLSHLATWLHYNNT